MKKQILLLDDEPSITFGLSRCLASDQVEVISCNDPDSARTLISNGHVDAVIADVNLFPSDSDESTSFLQYIRSRSEMPVIMMSALNEGQTDAIEGGANHFLEKPFTIEKLIEVLHGLGLEVGKGS